MTSRVSDMGPTQESLEQLSVRVRNLSNDWFNVVTSTTAKKRNRICVMKDTHFRGESYVHVDYEPYEKATCIFHTGSTYSGTWQTLGMHGYGTYQLPNGVEYEGNLRDGMFHGEGTLTYPMGQKLDGQWARGRMVSFKFRFADGLEYEGPWKYCQMPDRRYFTSIQEGLRPAGRSLLTNNHPPRKIPDGCYDTGDGFYNPATKCVMSAYTPGKILRVPTAAQEKWIMENCRKAWDEPTGYRPDLYEHWVTGRSTDSVFNPSEESSSKSSSTASTNAEQSVNMIVPPVPQDSSSGSVYNNWWDSSTTAKS